jgi:hypothetical protein
VDGVLVKKNNLDLGAFHYVFQYVQEYILIWKFFRKKFKTCQEVYLLKKKDREQLHCILRVFTFRQKMKFGNVQKFINKYMLYLMVHLKGLDWGPKIHHEVV